MRKIITKVKNNNNHFSYSNNAVDVKVKNLV